MSPLNAGLRRSDRPLRHGEVLFLQNLGVDTEAATYMSIPATACGMDKSLFQLLYTLGSVGVLHPHRNELLHVSDGPSPNNIGLRITLLASIGY